MFHSVKKRAKSSSIKGKQKIKNNSSDHANSNKSRVCDQTSGYGQLSICVSINNYFTITCVLLSKAEILNFIGWYEKSVG